MTVTLVRPPAPPTPEPAQTRRRVPTLVAAPLGGAVLVGVFIGIGRWGAGPLETVVLLTTASAAYLVVLAALSRARLLPHPAHRYRVGLMGPSSAYYAAFFLVPLGYLVGFAFARQVGYSGIAYGFHLDNVRAALNADYLAAYRRTLEMAVTGTVLVVLVGFPLAYWLARYADPRRRTLLLTLVVIPFWTSFLIRTMSFLIVLDPSSGLSRALEDLGLTRGPIDVLGTPAAVQLGMVYGYLPLFVLPAYAALERLDWRIQDAAGDLGAPPGRTMWQVTLPLAAPGLVTGALLVFIPMLGEYVIPQVLGGGKVDLVGNIIQRRFLTDLNYPQGAAVAVLLVAALSVAIAVMLRLTARTEVQEVAQR